MRTTYLTGLALFALLAMLLLGGHYGLKATYRKAAAEAAADSGQPLPQPSSAAASAAAAGGLELGEDAPEELKEAVARGDIDLGAVPNAASVPGSADDEEQPATGEDEAEPAPEAE